MKAQFNLATAYGASPKYGQRRDRTVAESDRDGPCVRRAHLALGKALLQDGKVPEAIGELQEAARLDPQSGEAHYQLGLAMSRAGRKDEGTAELQKGRDFLPRTIATRM